MEKAANIATVLQAIIVAVSVLFIWLQLRSQTKLAKVANTQALVEISSPFNLELIKNPDMAALWVNGSGDYEKFNDVRKYQYRSLLIWWLIFHENIFFQKQKRLLDETIYTCWDHDLQCFVKEQHLELRWEDLKSGFQDGFVKHVEELFEK
ncbi:MAG: hypothetical protein QOH41_2044 [Blastocatellia bacterium]|jgi:hypothetical protein|nr:hypothetical protein [Blastocatellia bacterium]